MKVYINDCVFTHVFHISDIHIRLYSRKEEYEYVFSELYRALKKEKNVTSSIIVITGDLLHNKNDLTPECIIMTFNFLHQLSLICPTVLIAGNHDALLNNKDRLDSITPILYNRNPANLYYLKDSGHYVFGNIIFTVNSVFDNQWKGSVRYDDKINIALYHGQIVGWKNNLGYSSEIGDKSVGDFKNFNLVMLGDIHKFQFMNKEKTMAYSGSLISQNFGETDPYHGYLIWNLTTKNCRFVKLSNPFAYMEGRIQKDIFYLYHYDVSIRWKTDELLKYIPKHSNLRVHLSDDKKDNDDFIFKMKQQLPEVKIQKKFYDAATTTNESDLKNPENRDETQWIITYLNEKLGDSKELINEILEFYKHNAMQSGQHPFWEILSLKFNDMFGYGKNNEINFTKIQTSSVTGIFGKNSNGKSTLIDIITFLLFGKITRGNNGNVIPKELINHHEKSSFGEIEFMVGNIRHRITKTLHRVKNDKIKIKEDYFVLSNERWIDHSEEHRKKTDKIIESLIGSYDSFLFTNVCLQYKEKQFRDLTQKDRKEFLYDLFGLNCFEKFKKDRDDELKKLRGEERVYREKIVGLSNLYWDELMQTHQESIAHDLHAMKKLNQHHSDLELEKELVGKKIMPSRYETLKEVIEYKSLVIKKENKTMHLISSLETEKKILMETSRGIDIYMIRGMISNLEKELESIPELDNEIYKNYITKSDKEWAEFYAHFQKVIHSSDEITENWQSTKNDLEQRLLCLQHDTITYDEQFVKISEWGSLKEKIKRYRTELASLLEKNNVIVSDISISTELLIEQINDIYNQYISSNCSMRIIQQILNELSDLVLNPDCYACINNPQFKKKNQLKLELEELEMRIKQLRARFLDAVKSLDLEIENFDSIEEVYSYTNDFIKKKRIKRSEELKKKELYSKKVNYYSNQIKIYENTNSYMLKKDCLEKKKCIENDLMSHPLKMKYEELLSFIKNMSIYDQLNISFQKKCKNHEQIRNELYKCLETEKKLIQSSDRISRINEELYTLNKDKNHLDIELQNLEKEIGIIKSNQEYILKKNSIEESRQSIMKEIKELNDQIIIKKTDFERIRTEHKEWLNNYDHHVDILKKIDSIQKIIECVDRDGLPLYLLNNYLPIIEANINDIIHIFLDKKMVFRIVEKDIIIGLNENGTISNFLGGMESFIFDLTLKMTFSKFSRQSRSNFFIIDEGISVFDQDRINNIHVLLNFLTGISEKTFLISHIPSIKDFVSQSIEVIKGDDKKSHLVCCF